MTLQQVKTLFININKVKTQEYEYLALLHGADIKGKGQESQSSDGMPLFGDPSSYENMSDEEKEALTQKMMVNYKSWAEQAL